MKLIYLVKKSIGVGKMPKITKELTEKEIVVKKTVKSPIFKVELSLEEILWLKFLTGMVGIHGTNLASKINCCIYSAFDKFVPEKSKCEPLIFNIIAAYEEGVKDFEKYVDYVTKEEIYNG